MNYKMFMYLALIAIILGSGIIYYTWMRDESTQFVDGSPQVEDEEEGHLPQMPPGDRPGNRTNLFEGLMIEIQELVNANASPEAILELVVNETDRMTSMFNQSDVFPEGFVSPMLAFTEELEAEIQGMIDRGATAQEVQELVSEKIQEFIKERSSMSPPG